MSDTEHTSRQTGKKQRDAKLPDSVKARRCAALAVMDVRANGRALELALAETEDYAGLEARDRAFARAIAATVFRRSGQIKAVETISLAKCSGRIKTFETTPLTNRSGQG